MSITTELKKDKLEYHAKIVISNEEIDNVVSKELHNLVKKVKIAGFRPGKVPFKKVQDMYGASVRQDAVSDKVNESIRAIIKDNNLKIVGDPKIEEFKNDKGSDIEFIVKFELMPEIELPDFKKITIEKPLLKLETSDIESQLNMLASNNKNYQEEVKGEAKLGDQVTLDAVGYVDGEAFEGGKLESHKLVLGSKSFIDNFEDQLVGHKIGDEVSVNVTFPELYHAKNLAGKKSEFKVKINAIHRAENSKIDDELAQKFKFDNLEALKEQLSKNISSTYDEPINTMMKMRLFDALENDLTFDAPDSMLEKEYQILKDQANQANELDDSLKAMSEEEINQYFRKIAKRRVKIGLMLADYIKIKGLKIDQNDIRNAVLAQARNYPGQEQQIIEFYTKNPKAIENLQGPILENKAVQNIFDQEVILKEKQYSKKDLEALIERENNKVFG